MGGGGRGVDDGGGVTGRRETRVAGREVPEKDMTRECNRKMMKEGRS